MGLSQHGSGKEARFQTSQHPESSENSIWSRKHELVIERPTVPPRPIPKISYTKGQLWAALRKAWRGYKIAKVKEDQFGKLKYGNMIRSLQSKLGLDLTRFPEVGLN
jgi:hypothetical protein